MSGHGQDRRDRDIWRKLAALTPARIALGRAGAGLPTAAYLQFSMAHAAARDAVHAPFDAAELGGRIETLGFPVLQIASRAGSREAYLRRPDLGRQLDAPSLRLVEGAERKGADLVIVVGDGLSSTAVTGNAVPMLAALRPPIERLGLSLGPVVVAREARVALGDEIGERLGAKMVLVLIGERPGLSSPDSLGTYLTFAPRVGRTDAERNCISNIRPGGLPYDLAAFKQAWLIEAAFARRLTGVDLKENSDMALAGSAATAPLPGQGDGTTRD